MSEQRKKPQLNMRYYNGEIDDDLPYTGVLNYDEEIFILFKELRTLNWLNIRPPVAIRAAGETSKSCYANATALRGALFTYTQIIRQTDPQVLELAAEYHQAVRDLIAYAVTEKITWQSFNLKE